MDTRTRIRLAAAIIAALTAASAFRSAEVAKTIARASPDPFGIQIALLRFGPAASRLPSGATVGYLSDLPPGDRATLAFLQAQYALAPRLLISLPVPNPPEWAVGNFASPEEAHDRAAAHGYQVYADLGRGVILLHRKGGP